MKITHTSTAHCPLTRSLTVIVACTVTCAFGLNLLFRNVLSEFTGLKTKNTLLIVSILILAIAYSVNEFQTISMLGKLEPFLVQTLFVISFIYFFKSLNLFARRTLSFYVIVILCLTLEAISIINVVLDSMYRTDCWSTLNSELDPWPQHLLFDFQRFVVRYWQTMD